MILYFILTVAVALAGGFIAKTLKVPVGAMIGAMIAVCALNIAIGKAYMPEQTSSVMQISGGALLGYSICRRDLAVFKKLLLPAVLLTAGLIGVNILIAYMLDGLFDLGMATSLFASAPGGVSEMALIAMELDADTSAISIMQFFRLFIIYITYPPIFKFVAGRRKKSGISSKSDSVTSDCHCEETETIPGTLQKSVPAPAAVSKPMSVPVSEHIQEREVSPESIKTPNAHVQNKKNDLRSEYAFRFIMTLLFAVIGGILFHFTAVPAGEMAGGLIGSCIYNLITGKARFPSGLRFYIQAGVGALIGCRMTMESVLSLRYLLLPILLTGAVLMVFTVIYTFIMYRIVKMDICTTMLSVTPGGIQEMAMIGEELGCDTVPIIILHTVRLVAVICIFPFIFTLLI